MTPSDSRTALVFGKSGQLATELGRLVNVGGLPVYCAGRDEADLSVPGQCSALIEMIQPSIVINAAAYTTVDKAEDEVDLAMQINGKALGEIAQACARLVVPVIHISTDYVFDGSGTRAWRESDPVSPLGSYGVSKAMGEDRVRSSGARHIILRVSWVFSDTGSNFVKTMLRLGNEREALSIVGDQRGCPTPAAFIAEAIDQIASCFLADLRAPAGTYHLSTQPACSWFEFASAIFEHGSARSLTGSPKLTSITTDQYPTPARRPLNSVLDGSKLASDYNVHGVRWQDGLLDVLDSLKPD